MLFDFDVRQVVNCIPINKEGLYKIHHRHLTYNQKGPSKLKVIYYYRERNKVYWLDLSDSDTVEMLTKVALSLQTLNKSPEGRVIESFMPK